MTHADSADDSSTSIAIPHWFVRLAAGMMTLAVPWAAWVTVQLVTIGVRIEATTELRQTVDRLQAKFTEHLADPDNHTHGLREFQRRLDRVEAQLDHRAKDPARP